MVSTITIKPNAERVLHPGSQTVTTQHRPALQTTLAFSNCPWGGTICWISNPTRLMFFAKYGRKPITSKIVRLNVKLPTLPPRHLPGAP